MKNLLSHIWRAPFKTASGALIATGAFLLAADVELPKWLLITVGALSAFLGAFSGPSK